MKRNFQVATDFSIWILIMSKEENERSIRDVREKSTEAAITKGDNQKSTIELMKKRRNILINTNR